MRERAIGNQTRRTLYVETRPPLSVIVSAYNRPAYLELALWGFATQSDRDFELVVADNGSGAG